MLQKLSPILRGEIGAQIDPHELAFAVDLLTMDAHDAQARNAEQRGDA